MRDCAALDDSVVVVCLIYQCEACDYRSSRRGKSSDVCSAQLGSNVEITN